MYERVVELIARKIKSKDYTVVMGAWNRVGKRRQHCWQVHKMSGLRCWWSFAKDYSYTSPTHGSVKTIGEDTHRQNQNIWDVTKLISLWLQDDIGLGSTMLKRIWEQIQILITIQLKWESNEVKESCQSKK